MKSFSEYIIENQLYVGDDVEHSLEVEWLEVKEKAKKVKSNIKYSIYEYKDKFFIIDKNKYIGHIENYDPKIRKTLYISTAYMSIRGLYKEVMLDLLKSKRIKTIISDPMLSTPATKYWLKIIKDKNITKILVDNEDKIIFKGKEFSDKEMTLFNDEEYRIGMI